MITYNSIALFPSFDIVKKRKIEFNIGVGVSKTFFWTSTPAINLTDTEHLNVKYDGGAFYTAPFVTGNIKYLFNNNTFIALSFDYEYYPYRYYIQTFSSKISFGVKF